MNIPSEYGVSSGPMIRAFNTSIRVSSVRMKIDEESVHGKEVNRVESSFETRSKREEREPTIEEGGRPVGSRRWETAFWVIWESKLVEVKR